MIIVFGFSVMVLFSQFRERLKNSHDSFLGSLKQLEAQLTCRLERTEGQQTRIKKVDAPKLARLSLESTSLRDMILYGKKFLSGIFILQSHRKSSYLCVIHSVIANNLPSPPSQSRYR